MKMNNILNIRKLVFSICITCLLLGGCTDDNVLPASQIPLSEKTVTVKLNLGIEDYNTSPVGETRSAGDSPVLSASYPDMDIELVKTPVTRAAPVAGITEENAVYKYIILQFNGTGEGATLVKKGTYNCPNGIIKTDEVAEFLTTGGPDVKHRFVILANIDPEDITGLSEGSAKYSDLQNIFFSWSANSSFPLHQVTLQDGAQKNAMIMCGMTYAAITGPDQQIAVGLQRTVAKVTFNIKTDNQAFDKFKKWDVALINIPSRSYFSTLGRSAVFPDMTTMNKATSYWSKLLTKAPVSSSDLGGDPISSLVGKSAYIPVNLQKTVNTATTYSRRDHAPVGGTYLQIMGRDMKESGSFIPIVKDYVIYQIFLGKNLTTDYSIYPNYNLAYNITLKGRDENDSNVIRFIPGYFSGALTAYDSSGKALTSISDGAAVKWQYAKRIEAYYSDAHYSRPNLDGLVRTDLRWYAGNSFDKLGATSLMDGFANTKKLQSNDVTGSNAYFVNYPAAEACYEGLNGLVSGGQSNFQWYLPSIGELIGTWISSASTAPTLSPSYWSSTAASDNSKTAYIITTQGEVKLVPADNNDTNRHYVRGVRDPETAVDVTQ